MFGIFCLNKANALSPSPCCNWVYTSGTGVNKKKEWTDEVLVIIKYQNHVSCFIESLQMNFSGLVFIQTAQSFIRPVGSPPPHVLLS